MHISPDGNPTVAKPVKCFAINVEKNTYRRDHILEQGRNAGIDVHIFKAITPETMSGINHRYSDHKAREFTGRPLMPTEIACGLSHITLWRQLLEDKDVDHYLILEDDVIITRNIANILKLVDLTKINFLKLSGQRPRPMRKVQALSDTYTLYKYAFGPLDAATYIISKKGAKALIKYCETMHSPIDILMDRSYDHGVTIHGILPYASETVFCFEHGQPLFTDIGIRDHKYTVDITCREKMMVRYNRICGSIMRTLATLRTKLG